MVTGGSANGRRPLSIALRMTVWYAVSAFTLIVVATGFLYWVLVTNLEREDIHILQDNLNNVRLLLRSSPPGALPQTNDREVRWATTQQPQIYVRIIDSEGRTFLETPGMSEQLPAPTVAQLAALGTEEMISREIVSHTGRPFQTLSTRDKGQDGVIRLIQVAMDRDSEERLLARYRDRFWLVLSLSVILCSLAGYLIARSGMRPIEDIGRTAKGIRSATLHERMGTAGLPAELSWLAETFNNMLDRLQESFARISQFSDDVAHELRTPINNLRGEIEVALSKARSNEEYRDILGSNLEECARISRLIQSLLFLARAENTPEPLQREDIDVGKELTAVREFYEAAAAEAGVGLLVSVANDLRAPLDRTLFQQAVGNLVSNAIAHTPKDGTVGISAHADESGLKVCVTDTGCGIPPEHLPRVWERFYRVDRARSGSSLNVGLGLSVVKSIVEMHGGSIEIQSRPGEGTLVSIRFQGSSEVQERAVLAV